MPYAHDGISLHKRSKDDRAGSQRLIADTAEAIRNLQVSQTSRRFFLEYDLRLFAL